MTDILDTICAHKKHHIAARKALLPLAEIKALAALQAPPKGFIKHLKEKNASGLALITEIKKASPSKGVIREDFNPLEIARTYKENGAACLSVLTDEPFFQGHDDFLKDIKSASLLPLLRKDFMLDPYQIFESRALGADCILLIMSALSDPLARQLYDFSKMLGMDVLVEVHNTEELERALAFSPEMIGVNNRNLKTLTVDIQTSFDLVKHMPDHILKISESGLSEHETLLELKNAGYSAFLVGESLMRQADIGAGLRNLLKNKNI